MQRASSAFWWEWHRELRRQAGDERLPPDVRVRVRESAQRALARSTAARPAVAPFPRRALRDHAASVLSPSERDEARGVVKAPGLTGERPFVAIQPGRRPDLLDAAARWLVGEGYEVARIGAAPDDNLELLLSSARFLVCEAPELQRRAYRTATPTLLLNASEPFTGYPVRGDGLFTLATAIDLDSGQVFSVADMTSDRYFRNLRNVGYRMNSTADVLSAVQEMHEGLAHGWRETGAQTRFRNLVVEAGASLAPTVPLVAEWGPDAGFIGDGRLARFQADRLGAVR
jgi:hypothetical protein